MYEYGEITLIPQEFRKDEIGQPIGEDSEASPIEFRIGSITRLEWQAAMQGGFMAETMGTVFTSAYNGEKEALFRGKRYDIYRTFRRGDETELYLGQRVGVTNVN